MRNDPAEFFFTLDLTPTDAECLLRALTLLIAQSTATLRTQQMDTREAIRLFHDIERASSIAGRLPAKTFQFSKGTE